MELNKYMCTQLTRVAKINHCCVVVLPKKNSDVDVRAGPLVRRRLLRFWVILLVYEGDMMSSQHQVTGITINKMLLLSFFVFVFFYHFVRKKLTVLTCLWNLCTKRTLAGSKTH